MLSHQRKIHNSFFLPWTKKGISTHGQTIEVTFFFAFDNLHRAKHNHAGCLKCLAFEKKSLEKGNHSVAKFACASKPFQRDIDDKGF